MDGGECMPPYEEYNPEEEYEEYNPYNPEEEDEDQYLEEETSWEEDEPNVGYCTHDGQTYPPSTVMGTYVCVDGEWVDSSDDSLNYGGCVMDGITYGEGTQIGPYMCVNGEWIDIS